MNRILLPLFALGVLGLHAADVSFSDAPKIEKRKAPNSQHEILSFNAAIESAKDAIVYISTTQSTAQKYMNEVNPLLERFFGHRLNPRGNPRRQSLGSGVIVTADGYIITNSHVIEDADSIMVKIPDAEEEYKASLIGSDPKSDLAVIKIDATGLKPISMGHSDNVKIGDVTFAIGNPFGVGLSVTQGIVSARHKDGMGINEYENFIQTDASINPGNSGGALVDSRGALIGINSAIITRSGGNNGIGFAIEVDMVRDIARKLIENGSVARGYLGISIANLTTDLKQLYTHDSGAIIIDILSHAPASDAGLKRGDLIVRIDSNAIEDATDLKNTIGKYQPGSKVRIDFERDGENMTRFVTLGSLDGVGSGDTSTLPEGLELENLNEQYRYRLRIPDDIKGVLITEVDTDSTAAEQGIRPGDVIVQVEQQPVQNLRELSQAMGKKNSGLKRIYVYRQGRIFVTALQ